MRMKKIYDWNAPRSTWTKNVYARHEALVNPTTGETVTEQITPPVSHVRMITVPDKQRLSPRVVEIGQTEGWLAHVEDRITIRSEDGPVIYRVMQEPGRHCCHCGEKLPDDDNAPQPGVLARKHVKAKHDGVDSPDKQNPSGYSCKRYYACEKVMQVAV